MLRERYMRVAFFSLLSLLFWAGTVSINYGNRTSSPTSQGQSCSEKGNGEILLNHLQTGRILRIKDNGQILTVVLTSHWSTLPPNIQYDIYEAVDCYARAQQQTFQFTEIP